MEALTKPIKHGVPNIDNSDESAAKKAKTTDARDFQHGVVPVKAEFVHHPLLERAFLTSIGHRYILERKPVAVAVDDDAAEASHRNESESTGNVEGGKKRRGQNKARKFHWANDEFKLCQSLCHVPREGLFDTTVCEYAANAMQDGRGARNKGRSGKKGGRNNRNIEREAAHQDATQSTEALPTQKKEKEALGEGDPNAIPRCAFVHNLREYLKHKAADIEGVCPAWQARGVCASGWRCKWLGSHAKEENGELFLLIDEEKKREYEEKVVKSREDKVKNSKADVGAAGPQDLEKEMPERGFEDPYGEIINLVPMGIKIAIRKNKFSLKKSEEYLEWHKTAKDQQEDRESSKAAFVDTPLKPEEKRKLYIGRETPMLAPLTYVLVYSLFLLALTTRQNYG